MTTATILSSYIGDFESFVDTKNRKAAKLGCPEIKYTISAPYLVERSIDGSVANTRNYEYVDITVDESEIKLNGFNVIGRIDNIEGNIIVSGMSDMTKYRNISMSRCDHCNVSRNRNHLVLLTNGESEIVVGGTCLKDYTSNTSALAYLSAISWVFSLQETLDGEGMSSGGRQVEVIRIDHLLKVTSSVVREYGYVSKTKAEETNQYMTKEIVIDACFDPKLSCGVDLITEKDEVTAAAVVEWFENTEHADSDFFHNCGVFMSKGYVPIRFAGYIIGLLPWYMKTLERAATTPSQHIGTVGQKKVRMRLSLIRSINLGQYTYGAAATYMYIFRAGNDMVRYNTTMAFDEDKIYEVEATIKSHADYKGTAQTIITRAKILTISEKV